MAMSLGGYLSTAGHVGLIGFLFLGPGFEADPLPTDDIQQVSVISEAEFLALSQPAPIALSPGVPVALAQPEVTEAPEPPAAEPPVVQPPAPDPANAAEPDQVPVPPTPAPQADVTEEVSVPPLPDVPAPIEEPVTTQQPAPRPVERIAPRPIAAPEPDTQVADDVREAVSQDDTGDVVAEEQVATSPEEATTQTVTEAEEVEPSGAVTASLRPQARPTRPVTEPETEETSEVATTEPAAEEDDPLAAALSEALADRSNDAPTQPTQPTQPTGPPLTTGERDALRVAVSRCWNVGSLSTEALSTTVIVGVDMARDGTPSTTSIRLISSSGGSSGAAQQAFEAARRAIIRCGVSGFDLPAEKYDQWRQIEMTFNPEQMRTR